MPTPHAELLSLIARADQLVAEADNYLDNPPNADTGAIAEDIREMLVELTARIEGHMERLS